MNCHANPAEPFHADPYPALRFLACHSMRGRAQTGQVTPCLPAVLGLAKPRIAAPRRAR